MIIPDSIKVDNDEFMNFPYHALVKNFEKKNIVLKKMIGIWKCNNRACELMLH